MNLLEASNTSCLKVELHQPNQNDTQNGELTIDPIDPEKKIVI